MSDAALEVQGLNRAFGALPVTRDVNLYAGARRAARADRPEWRRQDDAGQSDHRRAQAVVRPRAAQRRGHYRDLAGRAGAARAGAHLPDQPVVPRPDGARKPLHDDRRARRPLQQSVALGRLQARGDRRGARSSGFAAAGRRRAQAGARIALWPPAAGRNRHRAGAEAARAAARRAGGRRAVVGKPSHPRRGGRASIPTSPF